VSASREIAAAPEAVFELIADPSQHPRWDGNDNNVEAAAGQRVHAVGDVFRMTIYTGAVRENHIVEFEEGRRIAWLPAEEGKAPPGHLWRWEIEPVDAGPAGWGYLPLAGESGATGELVRVRVTHTYDWTNLTDEARQVRARATTADKLLGSIDRLNQVVHYS
jgi:uncharacterized protein YndB with AHSA1/START domain